MTFRKGKQLFAPMKTRNDAVSGFALKLLLCAPTMAVARQRGFKIALVAFGLSSLTLFGMLPQVVAAQSQSNVESIAISENASASALPDQIYVRPTQKEKINNYVFDTFGPYPIAGAAFAAGIGQLSNAPPEWHQGMEGYGKRMGSSFGMAVVGTSTRYAFSQALKEDTVYYQCDCRGMIPRLSHALLSTVTARRGQDGHRVFSIPALIAPYAGSAAAVYGWYPDRFGAKDAFRIGSYNLLATAGGNVLREFVYRRPHSLLPRLRLNRSHEASGSGTSH